MSTLAADLQRAYSGRRVFLTGHTGFKGTWLTLWLRELGAEVSGFALAPDTDPSLFQVVGAAEFCRHEIGDIRDPSGLRRSLLGARPDVVFHLAAQPLVRLSYQRPLETVETNVLGTANLLEIVRTERLRVPVVVVTTDKCYENREWVYGYREDDPLGGRDVYSASKAAAELVAASYRSSFFPPHRLAEHGVALATARAGNVVGGGDWAADRIVPDAVKALTAGRPVPVRHPDAVRPWQHVLEPLAGYLLLGARLLAAAERSSFCGPWNFGPRVEDCLPVRRVVELLVDRWGSGQWDDESDPTAPHEAGMLRLSIDKAQTLLGWSPRWTLGQAIGQTADWYLAFVAGATGPDLLDLCVRQISDYESG